MCRDGLLLSAALLQPSGLSMLCSSISDCSTFVAGEDGLLLAFSAAVEGILPSMPPPPTVPACQGCTPLVKTHKANYSGSGKPQPGDVTSIFSLHFEGDCALTEQMQQDRHGPHRVREEL